MKNAEGVSLPFELDRRLKQRIEHLRDVRESLEKLGRSSGSLQRMFAAEQERRRAAAAAAPTAPTAPAAPAVKEAKGRTPPPAARTPPPPPPPSSAPAKPAEEEEDIPAWRKLFPDLSAEVPGRKK
ncbi:hypothetical protein JQX13_32860 [Archangium violaceum]|uniref:hypothetical protein n=1 Tax=Archangium violaceum TaxID=83451 RepID=UPI00193C2036|nr:hypothetical protein [Archangium violaceum]QRK04980.1 hypothetical protein JQX13_32860 [Archangium violaceum]